MDAVVTEHVGATVKLLESGVSEKSAVLVV